MAAANTAASRAFVRGLARAGVGHACITPGSRSTPLTVAFAEQRAIRPWLHLDERSAAFFALGMARATGRPVALVCTSGTAAANYLPAVVEAHLSRIPLVVCTTDRPPRLRDAGAPQAIDQVKLFGTSVRWAADLPLPAGTPADEVRFAQYAERAVRAALGALPGPVHLNLPFEEPLVAAPGEHPGDPYDTGELAAFAPLVLPPAAEDVARVAALVAAARRPLIVAGPETGGLPAREIAALAAALDAPILADPLSGLRTGAHDRSRVCVAYDALLRDLPPGLDAPDLVLRFGAAPTSKALNLWLAGLRGTPQVLIDRPGGFRDFLAAATHMVEGDAGLFGAALDDAITECLIDSTWVQAWTSADSRAARAMLDAASSFAAPFEGRVFTELQAALPAGATIVAGNSMPVRDLDSFIQSDAKPLHLVSNRGANGIDGVVSSALGAAAVADGPVVLVIGDVSFYHDMNGLWAAKRHNLDLTIVLVNNNGGGIFNFLPQAAHEAFFEEWFGTPPDLDFAHAVALYGGRYTLARDWAEFAAALPGRGLNVIELRTDRLANVAMHQQAWAHASAAARGEALAAR
ncbi:MAG: 2-succinyl-5-enolpyruvyl-6-hydroxy-3-cyclohexene-1-carboxylic-acid synthase [Dehalococcoidia bacterium]|nr:2-succinyl-5-enolpyruvyl-6-hydroxy-3-cyclohexene-1-carboxylic-acid synthase [Dehalococcoidia bacterium]